MHEVELVDWRDPRRIPKGFSRGPRLLDDGTPNPAHIQANLFTLAQIGGLYDGVAISVEEDHLELLTAWRLVSQAPTVLDYLRERDQNRSQPKIHNDRRHPDAQSWDRTPTE